MMANNVDGAEKELAEKIQQFLSFQIESSNTLNEAAKESLTVASECLQQAFSNTKKPASNELLDLYKAHKANPNPSTAPNPDPAQLISNLASTLFSQVGSTLAGAAASAAASAAANAAANMATGAATNAANGEQQQQQTQGQQQQASAPNQEQPTQQAQQVPRKQATEAEKLAAESFKTQGNDLMREDKFQEAYDCYTKAISIDNNNAVYYSNRAAASAKLNDHAAALRDCEEAIKIDPNYSKAYGRKGMSHACLGDHQRAKEAYAKAVELDPTNESYRNNLRVAEEALASGNVGGAGVGAAAAGAGLGGFGVGLGGAAAGAPGAQMANMLRSMMSNPEVVNMAMRSLQDPRLQGLLGGLAGAATGQPPAPNNQP